MELKDLLQLIISGAMVVPVTNFILNKWKDNTLNKGQKRALALGVCFLLGISSWFAAVYLGYLDQPATTEAMVNELFVILASVFGISQVTHGMVKSDVFNNLTTRRD